jgi:hypothetical protein
MHLARGRPSKAAEQVKSETNGRFELQLFPNNQLGADSDMLSQLRSGALECFLNSGVNVLSTLVPAAAISGVGFAFKDYPAVWNALDGKLGANLRGQVTKSGIVVLDKVVTVVLWAVMLAPAFVVAWILPAACVGVGFWFVLGFAALLAGNVLAAFLKPVFLVMIMSNFQVQIENMAIDP